MNNTVSNSKPRVLIPLAQGCEELEAVTLIDLLVRADIEVCVASLDDNKLIRASRGVQLVADYVLADIASQPFDMVVLPGGLPGSDYLADCSLLHEVILTTYQQGGQVAAICAAPKVLVKLGLLDGKQATSFPGVIDVNPGQDMRYIDLPVVVDGQIITSRGPGTAMDFALTLIEMLLDYPSRAQVEQGLMRCKCAE